MELLVKILSIPIVGTFLKFLYQFFTKEKAKELNIEKAKFILDNCGKDFKESFVIPNLEESYFYERTGIATNYKSIPLYEELKNKSGKNYTWASIRKAKSHFLFEENKIVVKVSTFDKSIAEISLLLILYLSVISFGTTILLSQISWGKDFMQMIIMILFLMFVVGIVAYAINPTIMAMGIKKELEKNNKKSLLEDI